MGNSQRGGIMAEFILGFIAGVAAVVVLVIVVFCRLVRESYRISKLRNAAKNAKDSTTTTTGSYDETKVEVQ
jgi:predicted small secreted protein